MILSLPTSGCLGLQSTDIDCLPATLVVKKLAQNDAEHIN